MNRENIQKVRDRIASLPPERFDMAGVFMRDGDLSGPGCDGAPATPGEFMEACGTAACIAGWTLAVLSPAGDACPSLKQARGLLGLGLATSHSLFIPDDFCTRRYTPDEAVRVLDHLLETGEVDWERAKAGGEA